MLRDILVISLLIICICLFTKSGIMADNGNESADNSSTHGHITKCDRVRCVCCKSDRLCLDRSYFNYVTGEEFHLPQDFKATCSTKNCIYLIKCKQPQCQYQYGGHTTCMASARIGTHKSSILNGKGCKLLRKHFTKIHSIDDMMIMPIAQFPANLNLKQREEIEESYILKLNTLFPYGINARCKNHMF